MLSFDTGNFPLHLWLRRRRWTNGVGAFGSCFPDHIQSKQVPRISSPNNPEPTSRSCMVLRMLGVKGNPETTICMGVGWGQGVKCWLLLRPVRWDVHTSAWKAFCIAGRKDGREEGLAQAWGLYLCFCPAPCPPTLGTAPCCTEECFHAFQSSEANISVGSFCRAFSLFLLLTLFPLSQKKSLKQESSQSYKDLRLKAF